MAFPIAKTEFIFFKINWSEGKNKFNGVTFSAKLQLDVVLHANETFVQKQKVLTSPSRTEVLILSQVHGPSYGKWSVKWTYI